MITVNICSVPGPFTTLALNDGSTIEEALTMASMSAEGKEIRLNDTIVDTSTVLEPGGTSTILLLGKIKGNK